MHCPDVNTRRFLSRLGLQVQLLPKSRVKMKQRVMSVTFSRNQFTVISQEVLNLEQKQQDGCLWNMKSDGVYVRERKHGVVTPLQGSGRICQAFVGWLNYTGPHIRPSLHGVWLLVVT